MKNIKLQASKLLKLSIELLIRVIETKLPKKREVMKSSQLFSVYIEFEHVIQVQNRFQGVRKARSKHHI